MILNSAWKDVTESISDSIDENELNDPGISAEILEDFYHVDDNVVAFEIPTDTDIAEELVRPDEEPLLQDEGEDDHIIERPVVSNSEATECIDKLRKVSQINVENGQANEQGTVQHENVHHAEDLNEAEEWFDAVEVQDED
ncbi:unnamed protein product [Allacma fusca]|uniref:Uncharacterized protein n=1 Tax=Allacma fusca TaxID=39272 RepID=A0A8J2KQ11_9HEXA|nr:unnamed protein product [Allacma fusca]